MGDIEVGTFVFNSVYELSQRKKKKGNKTSKYSKSLAKACGVYLTDYFSNLAFYILQQHFLP